MPTRMCGLSSTGLTKDGPSEDVGNSAPGQSSRTPGSEDAARDAGVRTSVFLERMIEDANWSALVEDLRQEHAR